MRTVAFFVTSFFLAGCYVVVEEEPTYRRTYRALDTPAYGRPHYYRNYDQPYLYERRQYRRQQYWDAD
jgi:hypothetical protein